MDVLAAVLAGGLGSRLGRPKASAPLAGRPLAAYPVAALQAAGLETVVVTRRDTPVPDLGVPVIHDRAAARHPLAGIVAALTHAAGRPVLAVAADLPFLNAPLLQAIAETEAPVVVPRSGGRLHPLCARYAPETLAALEAALAAEEALQRTIAALGPKILEVADARLLTNVNSPEDLAAAEASLRPSPAPPSSRSAPRP